VSEGAVAPVDTAVGWGPRTKTELCLECSMGAPPSSKWAPKVLPLSEQMKLVKGTFGAADQGHILTAVLLLLHTSGFSPILRTRVTLCSKIKVSSFQVCPRNPLSQPRGAPW